MKMLVIKLEKNSIGSSMNNLYGYCQIRLAHACRNQDDLSILVQNVASTIALVSIWLNSAKSCGVFMPFAASRAKAFKFALLMDSTLVYVKADTQFRWQAPA